MITDARAVLSPLLIVCYVFGTKIVEFPAGVPRLWLGLAYILLLWSLYYFLVWCIILQYMSNSTFLFQFYFWLNTSIALLSVVLGIYHDKKYRSCLRKLVMVDDTLKEIGTMTDYEKLYKRILLTVFGWFVYISYTICISAVWFRHHFDSINSVIFSFLFHYTFYVNLLDDLIITSVFGYIEVKFEQINEYIRDLGENKKHRIRQAWEHSALFPCQTRHPKSANSEYATWVLIHLQLELCNISRALNSIFGLQMTLKMGVYFAFVAIGCRELFKIIFIANGIRKNVLIIALHITSLAIHIFKLFIINYMCERVSVKAFATGNAINRIPYFTYDVVVRENITQFLLQINLTPLKFYGLGLFKFGLKFFHGFSSSVMTVIVILIQAYTE